MSIYDERMKYGLTWFQEFKILPTSIEPAIDHFYYKVEKSNYCSLLANYYYFTVILYMK